jgi:hypothetical protein
VLWTDQARTNINNTAESSAMWTRTRISLGSAFVMEYQCPEGSLQDVLATAGAPLPSHDSCDAKAGG